MKNPECYLGNDAEFEVFSFHEVIDMIIKAQKDAYNQAIKDSIKSIQNYKMIWGNGAVVPSNEFEKQIIKLKIK